MARGREAAGVDVTDSPHQVLHFGAVTAVYRNLGHLTVKGHRLKSKNTTCNQVNLKSIMSDSFSLVCCMVGF